MADIFVSYRHDDSNGATDRLVARLREYFKRESVFQDIDGIDPGSNWKEVINDRILECSVMVVVIGKQWLNAKDSQGDTRLSNQDDPVRYEIELGLDQEGVVVIPTVLRPATMPSVEDIPASIVKLCDIQEVAIYRGDDFEVGFRKLASAIDKILCHRGIELGEREPKSALQTADKSKPFRVAIGILLSVVVLIVSVVFAFSGIASSNKPSAPRSDNQTADNEDLERVAKRYLENSKKPDRKSSVKESLVESLGQPDYSNFEFRFDERIFSFIHFDPNKVSATNAYQSAMTMDRTLILVKTAPAEQVRFQARTTGKELIFSPGEESPPSHVEVAKNLTDTGVYKTKSKHICFDISKYEVGQQISISFHTTFWDAKEEKRSWFGAIAYPGCLKLRVLAIGPKPGFFNGLEQKKCSSYKSEEEDCSEGTLIVGSDLSNLLWAIENPEPYELYMFYFDLNGEAAGYE